MGEMADAAIEGACCSYCGVFFERAHGFPVLCRACWRDPTGRAGYGLATEKEL